MQVAEGKATRKEEQLRTAVLDALPISGLDIPIICLKNLIFKSNCSVRITKEMALFLWTRDSLRCNRQIGAPS